MDTLLTHAKVAMQPGKSATKLSTQLQDRMKEVAGHPNDLSKKKQMMQTLGLQYAPRIEALLQRADPRKRPLLDFALPGDLVRCKNELERDYKQYLQESAPPRGFEPKDKLTDTIARVSKDWVADSSLSPGVYSSQGYHITPSQGYAGSVHIQSHEEQQAIDDAVAGTRTAPSPTRTQPRSSHSDPQTREPSYAHQSERPTQTLGGLGLRPRSGNRDQSVADEGRSGNSSGNASLRSYSRQHSSADERPFSSEGDPAYEHSR
ncbi:hypothetical protein FPV67DRAFT_1105472 [Lyophyllum atratum]|nr:hypothetical protein FPV67DRAFT_1105472 [Lyophyllum atratum]